MMCRPLPAGLKLPVGQDWREGTLLITEQRATTTICEHGSESPLIKDNHDKSIHYQKLQFTKNSLPLKMFNHTIYTTHAAFLSGFHYPFES